MSATGHHQHPIHPQQQRQHQRHQRGPVTEYEPFESHIWWNPEVCNNCFTRVKRVHEFQTDHWGSTTTEDYRTQQATLGYYTEDVDAYGETTVRDSDGAVVGTTSRGTHGYRPRVLPRTTCTECGSVRCRALDETLSKREALGRLDALAERLREQDFDVDEAAMRELIHKGKSREKLRGYDRELFGLAVKRGASR